MLLLLLLLLWTIVPFEARHTIQHHWHRLKDTCSRRLDVLLECGQADCFGTVDESMGWITWLGVIESKVPSLLWEPFSILLGLFSLHTAEQT